MPQECVYDQTKLVVIHEIFRELGLNQRFHQYATGAGFHIRACEGYDPESKGMIIVGPFQDNSSFLLALSNFISWIREKAKITAKNNDAPIVPKSRPPFSIGLVIKSPKVAPNGLVKINAIQNSNITEILV